ncbi:hypothetical protein AA0Z99_00150 [Agrococcus sp. 1P02AA]|uniref:hypothetical protein n=1 Tax=Agrococcus sp. 1P02AA TaxID=3132259 RepID=UPI0039A5F65F
MELDELRNLPLEDQRVFLLGRIASETASMDASLRFLHAALRGEGSLDAFLDSPDHFANNVADCIRLIGEHGSLDGRAKVALQASVAAAHVAYRARNRFTHDMLRHDLLGREWELVAMKRPREGHPGATSVNFDGMVRVVLDLVAATWRLRGGAIYTYQRRWASIALGEVEGNWDGSANSSR